MKITRIILLFLAFTVSAIPAFSADYKVDTTFNPQIPGSDFVLDLAVLPDGKLIIAGRFEQVSGVTRRYIARLNSNGSLDTSFTSPFTAPVGQNLPPGTVSSIELLPNGQILVGGTFNVGSQYSEYARLNSDGTIDGSMTLGTLADGPAPDNDIEQLSSGKFLMCGSRNWDPFSIVYRMNADGTRDMSFHSSFAIGFCERIWALPDGKVMTSGFYLQEGTGTQIKSFHRLNTDGTKDTSFESALPVGVGVEQVIPLPDGKMFLYIPGIPGSLTVMNVNGTIDSQVPIWCAGEGFLPLNDGSFLTSQCRKFAASSKWWIVGRNLANGEFDAGFDFLPYQSGEFSGFRAGANGSVYTFGRPQYWDVNGARFKLIRLIPNNDTPKAKFDFDGDGRSDIAVFRPSNRVWYINRSTDGPFYLQWGLATDKLAAGNYDDDGKTDIGVYRDGVWYTYRSLTGYVQVVVGSSGDKPMFGEFNGWGKERPALRGLRSGTVKWIYPNQFHWFLFGEFTVPGEQLSDIPVLGDFEGDGRDEPGYFRNGLWYGGISDPISPAAPAMQWGIAGDIPVPGDYDGDRQTDYAIFRPSTGVWWINRSSAGIFVVGWGLSGDIPVPADYDGDGKTDIAIYRDGAWWQYRMGTGTVHVDSWGIAGDIPIPAQTQF